MTYIYFYLSKTVTCIIHSVHLFYNFSHLYFIGTSSLLQGPPQPRFKIGSVFRQLVKTTCTQVIFCNSGWQRGMGVVEDKLFSLITDLISWVKPPFPLFSPFTIYTIWVIKYFILIIVKIYRFLQNQSCKLCLHFHTFISEFYINSSSYSIVTPVYNELT